MALISFKLLKQITYQAQVIPIVLFAPANVSYNKASVDRNTVYVDANYEVAEDVEWFGRIMFTQNNSFGRYAPPAAPWNNMAADNPQPLW